MDIQNIIAMIASCLFGIGAVSAVIVKVAPKVLRYVHIATHALKFIDDLATKIAPDPAKGETKPTLTEDEIKILWQDLQDLQQAWKA